MKTDNYVSAGCVVWSKRHTSHTPPQMPRSVASHHPSTRGSVFLMWNEITNRALSIGAIAMDQEKATKNYISINLYVFLQPQQHPKLIPPLAELQTGSVLYTFMGRPWKMAFCLVSIALPCPS